MSKHWTPRIVDGARAGSSRSLRRGRGRTRFALLAGLFLAAAAAPVGMRGSGGEAGSAGGTISDHRTAAVIDGDTFRYRGEKIRIADIDTPELRGRCAHEKALAARATARISELLAEGPFVLERAGRDEDRYGRKLRVVTRGGRSLGDVLVAEGLARIWTGRREPWCET